MPNLQKVSENNSKVQAVEDHVKHQLQVHQLLKDNLTLAQNQMKQQAEQHSNKISLDVCD